MVFLIKKSKNSIIRLLLLLTLHFCVAVGSVTAAPYLPNSDDTIVETLALSWRDQEMQALRLQQKALKQNPQNANSAAFLARKYIELARKNADPRYYGYAESVLSPWKNVQRAPVAIMVLRATIFQHFHHFDAALNEFELILSTDNTNAQAWLSKASIELVTGKPKKSLKSCAALIPLADALVTTTCLSNALSMQGYADKAYTRLVSLYNSDSKVPNNISNEIEVWVLTTLAEIAQRLDHLKQSEAHYIKALQIDNNDSYLISSYADHLLYINNYQAAATLLQNKTKNNAHLLRLLIAEKKLQLPEFIKHKALLSARYQADAERQTASHLRDLARFNLHILNKPKNAFKIASQNWQQQKEPGDAYILLKSAIASDTPAALQLIKPMLDNNVDDIQLNSLSSTLRSRLSNTARRTM